MNLYLHLVAIGAVAATPPATHAALDAVAVRLRRARHHRLTRRHGRMLQRPQGGAR